jgi:hypothetical protein
VNGRIARKLRKVINFEPGADRYYICVNNANNFVLGNSGEPERVGGTIVEVTVDKNPVTTRAKYKYMKEKYYNGAF